MIFTCSLARIWSSHIPTCARPVSTACTRPFRAFHGVKAFWRHVDGDDDGDDDDHNDGDGGGDELTALMTKQ